MSSKFISWVAALSLVAVFAATGAFTLWSSKVDERNTKEVAEAREMTELYTKAMTAVTQAEVLTSLWSTSGNPALLVEQAKAVAVYENAIREIGQSSRAEDRTFSAWTAQYLGPISATFGRLTEQPPPPFAELLEQFLLDYVALYESVERGDLGDPALAAQLTNPAGISNPLKLTNPVTVIVGSMAADHARSADKAFEKNEEAERFFGTLAPILYGLGVVLVVVLLAVSLTFGKREERATTEMAQLRRLTTTDPLTQLGNRRGFEEATKRLEEPSGTGIASLVMMDLDEFKVVNDTFGHARGDLVLTKFAALLSNLAPPGASRFRIGGDEFALILHGLDGPASLQLAEKIRVAALGALGNEVTVSTGVAMLDPDGRDESLLLQQADAALYEAKMRGRNLAVLFKGDGHEAPLFPAAKLQAVRRLLEEGRIGAVFQPIWDINAQSLMGYEGLSRPDDDYGLDGPQQAFDIAEQFGHAADLDKLCRNHLLAASSELTDQPRLFLNLSPYSLTHQSFSPAMLSAELAAAGVEKSRVVFEITEKSNVPTSAIAEGVLALRSNGFSVALDDVGAGNNGLEMLRKVSFDYVKVDRGVILAAAESGNGRAGLMAILAFASESGAVVVAEGIEDVKMFELVCEVAAQTSLRGKPGLIHGVQGYLFGRPLAADHSAKELPPELTAHTVSEGRPKVAA